MIFPSWFPRRVAIALEGVDWDRVLLFARALLAIAFFLYPVWWIHVHVVSATVPQAPLSLAISFLGVQFAVIVAELLASCVVKKMDEVRGRRSRRWRPLIRRSLAAHLAGQNVSAELNIFRKHRPRETEICLAEMLAAVNGQARQRLSELAVSLHLVERWEKHATRGRQELREVIEWLGLLSPAIGGPALVRVLKAASATFESRWLPKRTLPATVASTLCSRIRVAGEAELNQICHEILAAPLLVRTMAASDLRVQADGSGAAAISRALSSADPGRATVALQLAEAWRRTIDAPALAALLRHKSSVVRGLALKLIPFQGVAAAFEAEVLAGLQTGLRAGADDAGAQEVLAGALSAVARLRLMRALPLVGQCASSANASLARQACFTLAALGEEGQALLESKIHSGPHQQAARAAESLMSLRAGRLPAGGI
ncbi:MAG TPA: hypothetical protein VN841_06325 [Bryobacteraceae bacterium]|nr:hypothetical protein [Bryobacteraceae bacterium]